MNIYADKAYKKFLLKDVARFVQRDMTVDVVDNGAFVVETHTGAFGVFDANGKLVQSALQWRGNKPNYTPSGCPKDIEFCDCDAVFMGNAYHHFGHFMIEHLNRAWGMDKCPNKNVKYVFVDNNNNGAKPWLFDFTDLLGIRREDVLILNKSVRFRRVFVPSQSFCITGKWFGQEFVIPFEKMRENVPIDKVFDKVYVSRAKLPEHMRTYGEEAVQRIFEKNGFHVIYPETLPLSQQVAIIGNARVLAGCAGTALHLALFMKPGGRVIQLNRTSAVRGSATLQAGMCQIKGLDFDVVAASTEKIQSRQGGDHAPQIISVTKQLRQFFDDNNFMYDADDLLPDTNAIAQYDVLLKEFCRTHGGQLNQKIKKNMIKIIACFIPGRITRGRVRKWLKEHW